MFLIVFDLFFQMQEKSHRLISKKGRNARFLIIVKLDQPGRFLFRNPPNSLLTFNPRQNLENLECAVFTIEVLLGSIT